MSLPLNSSIPSTPATDVLGLIIKSLDSTFGDGAPNVFKQLLEIGENVERGKTDDFLESLRENFGDKYVGVADSLRKIGEEIRKRALESPSIPVLSTTPTFQNLGDSTQQIKNPFESTPSGSVEAVKIPTFLPNPTIFPGTFGNQPPSIPRVDTPTGFGSQQVPNPFSFTPSQKPVASTEQSRSKLRAKVDKMRANIDKIYDEAFERMTSEVMEKLESSSFRANVWHNFGLNTFPKKYDTSAVEFFEDLGLDYKRHISGLGFVWGVFTKQ